MKCNVLVNILDEYNEKNILATYYFKPEKVIFLSAKNSIDKNVCADVEKFYQYKGLKLKTEFIEVEEIDYENIKKIISNYEREDTIINLSSGEGVLPIVTNKVASLLEFTSCYIDDEKEKIFILGTSDMKVIEDEFYDFTVRDFINFTGGKIIVDESDKLKDKTITMITNFIVYNFSEWRKIKGDLINPRIFRHDRNVNNRVIVNFKLLSSYKKSLLNSFFIFLEENKIMTKGKLKNDIIFLDFYNHKYKDFIFKTGTWLEIFTHEIVKGIDSINSVENGVLFLWDSDDRIVRNEADVLATTTNSTLFYISCKDTAYYDVDDLNDIQVYSEKLSGDDVKKILVTTYEPSKRSTLERAKQMDIEVIIFDGDVDKFRNELEKIIR
ncbi:Card1-like endonuclease domain-containing protein [Clostridium sp. DL1XJH146]